MNKIDYGFKWHVEKTKSLIAALASEEERIDCIKLQLFMNRHGMPTGYNRAMKIYDRLIEDGFLIRDCKNLGAHINKNQINEL